MAWAWVKDPHSGGEKIEVSSQEGIQKRINAYAATRPWHPKYQLQARFRGQFCYVDSLEPDGKVCPLGRFRKLSGDKWSFAFFTYSNDRYEPCLMANGSFEGPMEDGLRSCELYLV